MKISPNFDWAEVTFSDSAAREDIDNTLPESLKQNAIDQSRLMEQVRALLGKPVFISSWYRCQQLNSLIGGAPDSDHVRAHACDFVSPFGTPFEICQAISNHPEIKFGQMIHEFRTWVHISFGDKMEILTSEKRNGRTVYLNGLLP